MDGTYGFIFVGNNGLGIGAFVIEDGRIHGADSGSAMYDGTVIDNPDGTITLDMVLTLPGDSFLVTGTSELGMISTRPVRATFPPNFGDGKAVDVPVRPGVAQVTVKRIPDDPWAAYARGFTIVPVG
jgi:hypothetical protein